MKNIFIKVSGDLYKEKNFLDFLASISKDAYAVICVGGGTQINNALEASGFTLSKHGPLGRELSTLQEKQIAKNILEKNQEELQDLLIEKKINAHVITPMLELGTVTCHVNGDEMLRAAYLGFEELYVVTLLNRVENKENQFIELPKVKVVGI